MTLFQRWAAWPGDIKLAYATGCAFAAWCGLRVLAGPDLLLMLSSLLVFLALVGVAVHVAWRLAVRRPRRARARAMLVVGGCLAALVFVPRTDIVDLHLIGRVYLAGGPVAVNNWGQG